MLWERPPTPSKRLVRAETATSSVRSGDKTENEKESERKARKQCKKRGLRLSCSLDESMRGNRHGTVGGMPARVSARAGLEARVRSNQVLPTLARVDLNADELLELVAEGEGRTLEFKRGLPRDEKLARTLCAFANTRGGMLLVGVLDKGTVHGIHHPREVMATIRRIGRELLEPQLTIQTTVVRIDGNAVVAASIAPSLMRPHAVLIGDDDHRIMVRVGASNRIARGATLDALRRKHNGRSSNDPLEARVLAWVDERSRQSSVPGGDATVPRFADAHNIGSQRARRTFTRLERDGLLLGHGRGKSRVYHRP
jgi:hypothetical protein